MYLTGTDARRYLPRHVARAEGEGVRDILSLGNSMTAGPIALKFGVCLETS